MINLLPDQRKEDIRAARANVILLRYMGIIMLALAFLGGALYLSYSLLQVTMKGNEEVIASNDTKAGVYNETRQEVDTLSSQLSETKAILDQEVRLSKILISIGQLMPADTILGDLTLDSSAITGSPFEVTAYAKSASNASALQARLQNSPLFSQVSLSSTEENGGTSDYPAKIVLSLTFNQAGLR